MSADEISPTGFETASAWVGLLARGAVSAEELTRLYIERIERHDTDLNAVIVRTFDDALETARRTDALRARGQSPGPLQGLPMTVKESFDVAGLPTNWGNPAARSHIADQDAPVVARLKRAGATLLGKTNVPLNVADFQSYNEIYGQTNNPWDLARTPGGSSGGSAAAVAAGLTGMEFGADLGGSVRNPAHFCGVYAHKPTWGIVPFRSQSAPGAPSVAQDMDMAVPGPVARSAEDLALALHLTAGPDTLTAPGWTLNLPNARHTSLKEMRIALWPDDGQAPVDREISDRVVELGRVLSKAGAIVSDAARPPHTSEALWQTYRSLVLVVSGTPSEVLDHLDWQVLHLKRGQIREGWQQFFEEWDVLITPVTSTPAFPHDHTPPMTRTVKVNGSPRSYWEHVFWAGLATLPYLPATVFPTGLSNAGLPIGLQAIGAAFGDYTTIEFARLVAQEIGGFTPPARYRA